MRKDKIVESNQKSKPFLKTFIKDTFWIVFLISMALIVKSNTLELFKIPTGSMEPTLFGANDLGRGFGDHLLVKRWSYGLTSKVKIPLIGKNLPLPNYHFFKKYPKVGDVVVFENPQNAKIDYIKRCCGAPGDRVKISYGKLLVNGVVHDNISTTKYTNCGFLADNYAQIAYQINQIKDAKEQNLIKKALFLNGQSLTAFESHLHQLQIQGAKSEWEKMVRAKLQSEILVPTNSFFMLGDNSQFSKDSRYWGFAHTKHLKGQAWLVYLPFSRTRVIR